jgi:hypothetical protein
MGTKIVPSRETTREKTKNGQKKGRREKIPLSPFLFQRRIVIENRS